MKVAKVPRSRSLRFVITPMIDIVFLLIIFFLVATHFVKSETLESVELPSATQAEKQQENKTKRLVITITKENQYLINGRNLTWQELEAIILQTEQRGRSKQEQEIRIRGDANCQYQYVKPILIACAQAGVQKVSFAAVPVQ